MSFSRQVELFAAPCSMFVFPVLHCLQSWLKLMSVDSVMPSTRLIFCPPPHQLLLLPSIFPSICVCLFILYDFLFIEKNQKLFFFLPFHLNSSRPIDFNIASAQPTLQMHQEDKRQQSELISILIKGTGIGSGGWKPKDSCIW